MLASCVGETEASARLAEFRRLLTQLPLINYCTLRTLLRHLARSIQYISLVRRLQSVTFSLCYFACPRLRCCIICHFCCAAEWLVQPFIASVLTNFICPVLALGVRRPWFDFWLQRLFISYASPLILFSSLFPYLSPPFLSFPLRIDPLHFQAWCYKRWLNLALVFVFILCCSTFFGWC